MPTGTVKWFNNSKGYGFILPEGGGGDLFVHFSAVRMDGYRTLKAGQIVNYEAQAGEKGHHAVNVIPAGTQHPGSASSAGDPDAATARQEESLQPASVSARSD